uniref:hypothetical protein n=1 Tax=Planococcus sp. CAU13 TaxID=1541197 RepID=UPI001F244244
RKQIRFCANKSLSHPHGIKLNKNKTGISGKYAATGLILTIILFIFIKKGIKAKRIKLGVKRMKELVSIEEVKSFSEQPGLQFLYVLTTS